MLLSRRLLLVGAGEDGTAYGFGAGPVMDSLGRRCVLPGARHRGRPGGDEGARGKGVQLPSGLGWWGGVAAVGPDGGRGNGGVRVRRGRLAAEGAGEVSAGFGEQVAVAEAAAVVDRDDRGDVQGRGADVHSRAEARADGLGGEADEAQQVVDDVLADLGYRAGPPARSEHRQGLAGLLLGRAGVVGGAGHHAVPDLHREGSAGAGLVLLHQFVQALHGGVVAGGGPVDELLGDRSITGRMPGVG